MIQSNNSTSQSHLHSFVERMLVVSGIGLLLISSFLFLSDEPDKDWKRLWMTKPLIIVPIAGELEECM